MLNKIGPNSHDGDPLHTICTQSPSRAWASERRERVNAGLARAREKGTPLGRLATVERRVRAPSARKAWGFSRSVARWALAQASCSASFRRSSANAAPGYADAFELIELLEPTLGYRRDRSPLELRRGATHPAGRGQIVKPKSP